jgi:hypothetical protein
MQRTIHAAAEKITDRSRSSSSPIYNNKYIIIMIVVVVYNIITVSTTKSLTIILSILYM